MIYGHQPQLIEQNHLFQLVVQRDGELSVSQPDRFSFQLDVLIRIRIVVAVGRDQITVGATAQKIGLEPVAGAVPHVEDRTAGALPVQFLDADGAIEALVQLGLQNAAGPQQANDFGIFHRTQAEVGRGRTLTQETVTCIDFLFLTQPIGPDLNFGAHPWLVAGGAGQLYLEPVVGVTSVIAQQQRSRPVHGCQNIQIAIPVIVRKRYATQRKEEKRASPVGEETSRKWPPRFSRS